MDEILLLFQTADPFAALEQIHRHIPPAALPARYESLLLDLYWKAHDLPAVLFVGRAGVAYCLGQSLAPDLPADRSRALRSSAKSMAYNIASFTWPGWEEPGIRPTPDQLAFGHECAHLNLRLALELAKPPKALARAHWLLGAHALARQDFAGAQSDFQSALTACPPTDDHEHALYACNAGYLAIAHLGESPADPTARARFHQITSQLAAHQEEETDAYVAQLQTAHRLFVPALAP